MYRTLFPRDLFAELDRLQRDLNSVFEPSTSIRGLARGGYPALNVGSTPESVEVYAFAPGLDPQSIAVDLHRGVLTLSGERAATAPERSDEKTTLHLNERFAGRFRRVVSLPDDIDPQAVEARYRDGVLHVSVKRRASAQPRRIDIH
ncbi:MAG: Hsp20/alpha crystallin family protein [Aquabacterium sp.]|jgi:HSP20 family protein|nr:MAG: Hsp20/alpha crystallin family protein [Aquabacterium sp.]TAL21288.1 MAG: Hsp20/alpha crystallin family protein [Aquabacterium sp.]